MRGRRRKHRQSHVRPWREGLARRDERGKRAVGARDSPEQETQPRRAVVAPGPAAAPAVKERKSYARQEACLKGALTKEAPPKPQQLLHRCVQCASIYM